MYSRSWDSVHCCVFFRDLIYLHLHCVNIFQGFDLSTFALCIYFSGIWSIYICSVYIFFRDFDLSIFALCIYFSGILICHGRWIPVKVPHRDPHVRVVPGDTAIPTPSPPVPDIASIVFISLYLFTWLICVLCCHEEIWLTTASRHQIHDMIFHGRLPCFLFFFFLTKF